MAAFQEHQFRVNVEFLRASQSKVGRVIRFNHRGDVLPPQLANRMSLQTWYVVYLYLYNLPSKLSLNFEVFLELSRRQSFMTDVDALAKTHPYVQKPKAKDYGKWAACFAVGAVVGLFCVNPDSGDYGVWEQEANAVIQKHQAAFAEAGCAIGLRKGRDYHIQIDIDPSAIVTPPVQGDGKPPVQAIPAPSAAVVDPSAPPPPAAPKV